MLRGAKRKPQAKVQDKWLGVRSAGASGLIPQGWGGERNPLASPLGYRSAGASGLIAQGWEGEREGEVWPPSPATQFQKFWSTKN